jgi:aspartokinase/homoserine dehydrogenase 1
MKVLKFGGSSVGSPENILRVKSIVENQVEPSIIVVSAFQDVTDQLIKVSKLAMERAKQYSRRNKGIDQ